MTDDFRGNSDINAEQRDYAWNYFSLHAEQRLKTFHIFVLFSALVAGLIGNLFAKEGLSALISVAAFFLTFISFIFWQLDRRNVALIKHAEEMLMRIENTYVDGGTFVAAKLFSSEKDKSRRSVYLSFSDLFNTVFFVFAISGVILGCISTYGLISVGQAHAMHATQKPEVKK